MGSVVSFAPWLAGQVRKPMEPGPSAAVIFFSGVRYERWAMSVPDTTGASDDLQPQRLEASKPQH